MTPVDEPSSRLIRAGAVLLFWTVVGIFYALQFHTAGEGQGVPVGLTMLRTLPVWLYWAPVTPVVGWLGRRFRLERGQWLTALPIHLAAALISSVLHAVWLLVAFGVTGVLPNVTENAWEAFRLLTGSRFYLDVLTYLAILAGTYAVEYRDRFQERERRAVRLEAQLTRARLDALRMQLNPHFLFNALNAVAAEVRAQRNATAVRMLGSLGELLRYTLHGNDDMLVPLRTEMAYLERYLEIERARFADRLSVQIDVAPELYALGVPPLILQPLVENAIRHGIAPRDAPGRIEIRGHLSDGVLILTVRDDGIGSSLDALDRRGIGLRNVEQRLEQLYGEQRLHVDTPASGGFEARVEIPCAGVGDRSF